MKTRVVAGTIFLVLSLLFNIAAQAAQEPNPLFIEARNLWQQLSASSIASDTKAGFGRRFGDLARVQQQLWSLAGQVDSGACTDQCLDTYNDRVMAWQSNLESFNGDARLALESTSLPRTGVWTKYGKWTQVNVFCFQTYVCGPAETIMHGSDMKVVSTPAQTVKGMCQANASDPGCSECTAALTTPTAPCEWHLEQR